MAMGDALAVVLSQRCQFSKRSFSLCHPAGHLGKVASEKERDPTLVE
jgi:D-arabinose 5-phosphate isomerase GutQ